MTCLEYTGLHIDNIRCILFQRIKKLVLPGDPNYDILADAEDALFESANEFDLTPSKAVKEPVSFTAILTVLQHPHNLMVPLFSSR